MVKGNIFVTLSQISGGPKKTRQLWSSLETPGM